VTPKARRVRALERVVAQKPVAGLAGHSRTNATATNKQAISRLPANELHDRAFRFRVAFQQDLMRRPLPKEEWLKPEDDVRYLTPLIEEVAKEDKERAYWDSIVVERKAV